MKKKIAVLGTTLLLSAVGFTMANGQPTQRFDPATKTCRTLTPENLQEGYQGFQNNCKSCHGRGNEQGAPFLYTESKTMKGWNRVFAKKYPECADQGSWDALSLPEMLKINDYLYANAFDSSNPHCYV